jgi:hypothetical protein
MNRIRTLVFVIVAMSAIFIAVPFAAFAASGSFTVPVSELEIIPMDQNDEEEIVPDDAAIQSAGSWSASHVGPNLYQKGYWYTVSFSKGTQYVPANATITLVAWQWGVTNYRTGLMVWLGYLQNGLFYYTDVSSRSVGTSTDFNGLTADRTFYMRFGYSGTGALNPPTYGKTDTVTVSWTAP